MAANVSQRWSGISRVRGVRGRSSGMVLEIASYARAGEMAKRRTCADSVEHEEGGRVCVGNPELRRDAPHHRVGPGDGREDDLVVRVPDAVVDEDGPGEPGGSERRQIAHGADDPPVERLESGRVRPDEGR